MVRLELDVGDIRPLSKLAVNRNGYQPMLKPKNKNHPFIVIMPL